MKKIIVAVILALSTIAVLAFPVAASSPTLDKTIPCSLCIGNGNCVVPKAQYNLSEPTIDIYSDIKCTKRISHIDFKTVRPKVETHYTFYVKASDIPNRYSPHLEIIGLSIPNGWYVAYAPGKLNKQGTYPIKIDAAGWTAGKYQFQIRFYLY